MAKRPVTNFDERYGDNTDLELQVRDDGYLCMAL